MIINLPVLYVDKEQVKMNLVVSEFRYYTTYNIKFNVLMLYNKVFYIIYFLV